MFFNVHPYLGKMKPILMFQLVSTRWPLTSYKRSYNPYRWPYKWVTGVITLLIGVVTLLIINW